MMPHYERAPGRTIAKRIVALVILLAGAAWFWWMVGSAILGK